MFIDAIIGKIAIGTDRDHYLQIRAHPTNSVAVDVEIINKHLVKISKTTANVDYIFYVSDRGMKIDYNLKNSDAPDAFTLGFKLVGLTRQGRDIYNGEKLIGHLPDPFIEDANGNIIPVIEVIDEGSDTVYLSYDKESVTGWPAHLDPSFEMLNATADSYFYSTGQYYNEYRLKVNPNPSQQSHTVISFDFSALPDGAVISSAVMELYQFDLGAAGGHAYGRAYRITEPDVNISNCDWPHYIRTCCHWVNPGGDYDNASKSAIVDWGEPVGDWKSLVITDQIIWAQVNFNEVYNGILISESLPNVQVAFYSSEHTTAALRPKLTITYEVAVVGGGSFDFGGSGPGTILLHHKAF